MRRIKLPQLGVVILVCALVGALAGIAGSAAAPSKSSKKSAGKSSTKKATPRLGFRFRGGPGPGGPGFHGGPAVHAEAVVPNKAGDGFITVTSDAGTVKSVSGNDIAIDESVGKVHYKDVTVTIPDGATIIRNHAKASLSDIKADDDVRVIASSEQTIVIAEDAAFQKQELKRFRDHGPWERHGGRGPAGGPPIPPGAPPVAPQGGGTTY
jgi:GTPase involved in cell partitioning and DNA repair